MIKNGQILQTKNQQKYYSIKQYSRLNGLNYRAFHHKDEKYTLFSNVHGSFSKIDNMAGHKTSLNKFKKIEIISSIFSDHNGLKQHQGKKLKNIQIHED